LKRKLKILLGLLAATMAALLVVTPAAHADIVEDALIPESGPCAMTASISTRAVTPNVYAVRASGTSDCGSGVNTVEVCVQEFDAGTWNNRSCGAGTANNGGTASASAEYVCAPGMTYRARVIGGGTSGGASVLQKRTSGSITCPPLPA
jgi:hypothetical protein